MKLFTENYC